ncbi:MAG: peptidase [Lentisphaerae bacterium]|nr:peptidase [Lentisphaerota bacterium]
MKVYGIKDSDTLLQALRRPHHKNYFAMYSSMYGGIVTDPELMLVPIDDHMVHRGDGIFEAMKCVDGAIYNLHAHIDRLYHSAASMRIACPVSKQEMSSIILETARAAGQRDASVNVYVSRGPGSLGVNPRDSVGAQLFVMITRARTPFMEAHPGGARGITSAIPQKPPFLARVKSCNYLPNVLMKMEAEDAGVDFALAFDAESRMAEGATENVGLVTACNDLVFPDIEGVLAGTTMLRVMALAQELVPRGLLASARFAPVPRSAIQTAREMLVVGTTWNVSAAVEFDGRPVGDGKPGSVQKALDALLSAEIRTSPRFRAGIFN